MSAFFLEGRDSELDGSSRRRLTSAALRDLEGRYGGNRATEQRALLTVRDGAGEVVACAGVEPQPFLGARILRGAQRASPPPEALLRPVVSNLAVAARARRKGLAARLMSSCEEVSLSWGFDECLLLVESDNSRAMRLYGKLGYKTVRGGDEVDAPTLKVVDGVVADVRVRNVAMRKSLKPWPLGAVENAGPGQALAVIGAGAIGAALLSESLRYQLLQQALDAVEAAGIAWPV